MREDVGVAGAPLLPELTDFVGARLAELDEIPAPRRLDLEAISGFVADRGGHDEPARLTFICTHNSRRSQMAQLWAQAAARHLSVPGVETFSGGTEATAFNPRAVAALQRAGFEIAPTGEGPNPVYEVRFEVGMVPVRAYSKIYDAPPNPSAGFAAIMTCSAADAGCPVILGAEARIAIPYDDPKAFDGTGREAEMYDERCRQIAREMLFVFSRVSDRSPRSP